MTTISQLALDAMVQQYRRVLGLPPDITQVPPPPPPDNGAAQLVHDGWESAQDYATTAFDRATDFLTDLQGLADDLGNLPDISLDIGAITSTLIPYVAPTIPNEPGNMEINVPDAPIRPDLD